MKSLDDVLKMKVSEMTASDKSADITKGGGEERRRVKYKGTWFEIGRGHAFRDHATGPSTNPRFAGPDKSIEFAIMDAILDRTSGGTKLPKVQKVANPGTGVKVHGTPIRYCAIGLNGKPDTENKAYFMISDYMVWQGDPSALDYGT